MSVAIFELIDSGLGYGTSSSDWNESSGYAHIADRQIITGEEARTVARLDPQNSFNQYWQNLSLTPLNSSSDLIRHNADLAYAQLLQLHQSSNRPDEVLFAVPASVDSEQLSLLLGLAQASPFKAVGLVDSAVATVTQHAISENTLFIDLHLHQLVCTQLSVSADKPIEINRDQVEIFDDIGFKPLMDSWAHTIAEQFISQHRYDPLHSAQDEQNLYNQLPAWIEQLRLHPQTKAELSTARGRYQISLLRDDLLSNSYQKLARAITSIEKLIVGYPSVVISHRLAQLPALDTLFSVPFTITRKDGAIKGCLAHLDRLRSDSDDLSYITRLPLINPDVPGDSTNVVIDTKPTEKELPTHILCNNRAFPIATAISFTIAPEGIKVCTGKQNSADIVIEWRNQQIALSQYNQQLTVRVPEVLELGSMIELSSEVIQLIKVHDS